MKDNEGFFVTVHSDIYSESNFPVWTKGYQGIIINWAESLKCEQ